ncbi:type III secretion system cytoplasmic ring protein SctQ [Simkania negevensis]|uniref:Type III secretion system cytoplasmic ring protein SctQ n=1 Tax=Simkania negevensis TaxID=83561 RepID=A0ABS3AQK0_9BACT|nr:type III secretion system cytoplasmic ring protein SctQ [Simkania negevensis]
MVEKQVVGASLHEWATYLDPALLRLVEVPLLGGIPPFPTQDFSAKVCKLISDDSFSLELGPWEALASKKALSKLSQGMDSYEFATLSFDGSFSLLFNADALSGLMCRMLSGKADSFASLDEEVREGFLRFLIVELLNIANATPFSKGVSFRYLGKHDLADLPTSSLYRPMHCRGEGWAADLVFLLPTSYEANFKKHCVQKQPLHFPSALAAKVEVDLAIEVGRTTLPVHSWKTLNAGDILLLNQCGYDFVKQKGRVVLSLDGLPVMRGRVRVGEMKLLEYPFYHEVAQGMPEEQDNINEAEEAVEENLPEEENLSQEGQDDFLEGFDREPVVEKEEEVSSEAAKKTFNVDQVDLTVVVELTRFKMPVSKLFELEPGNVLQLDTSLESGVNLVINGRCVGRGELVAIGDQAGVRVTQLG